MATNGETITRQLVPAGLNPLAPTSSQASLHLLAYDGAVDVTELLDRVPTLELAVRSLTRAEIVKFVEAVRVSAKEDHVFPPDRRFWFDGTADVRFTADEDRVIRELWTRMNAGLVFAATGTDVDASIDRPGLIARLDRIGPRRQQIEGSAATILEGGLGGDVWLGTTGIWNALCAALLEDRLAPTMRDDLATSWNKVRSSRPVATA